jgi:hypothetical protein
MHIKKKISRIGERIAKKKEGEEPQEKKEKKKVMLVNISTVLS